MKDVALNVAKLLTAENARAVIVRLVRGCGLNLKNKKKKTRGVIAGFCL